jgi:hypothetical protein
VYYPTGNPTADGSIIPNNYKRRTHGWVAISRDLLKDYSMGDSLIVEGISEDVDGIYVIKDKTHPRIKRTIDILVKPGKLLGKWNNVKIRKHGY